MTNEPATVILGGSGHASDVLSIIEALDLGMDVVVADDGETNSARFEGRAVELTDSIDASLQPGRSFVAGVGYPDTRRALVDRADAAGLAPIRPLIHPSTVVATNAVVGEGSVVAGVSWISANARVGRHVYVGYGVKLGHDSMVGDFVSLMPGCMVSGDCAIGEGALIGANATVLQGLTIGSGAVVGAGAVVTKDVEANSTVVGSPATSIRK
ncbi:MAG: acetyltransferase [Acidimicrobiia bacterium]|nr:acetyltransferase [Acidimicrobiia bacterium]